MNPQQLAAFFAAHKLEILGGGAAVVALLGYRQRKKNASGSTSTTAGATIPGTIPAAAVVGTGNSTASYDSTAFDIYDALQSQISDLASKQQTGSPATGSTATPAPVASTLFAPTDSGQLVRYGSSISEVESDGSLYGLSLPEWQAMGSPADFAQLGSQAQQPKIYTRASNLATKIKNAPAGPSTVTQTTGA